MTSLKPLRLALIGMSGSGKSFWANKLARSGHPAVSCDSRIEVLLRSELDSGGFRGIGGLAAWMGWPDSRNYREREAKYLAAEINVLEEVIGELERDASRELILDTTGSVIYTGEIIHERLRRLTTVIYLQASLEEQALLVERYLTDPKPVLWRDLYRPLPGESPRDTVARCYPALIAERRSAYEAFAHYSLPIRALRVAPPGAPEFLAMIQRESERAR